MTGMVDNGLDCCDLDLSAVRLAGGRRESIARLVLLGIYTSINRNAGLTLIGRFKAKSLAWLKSQQSSNGLIEEQHDAQAQSPKANG